MPNAKNVKNRVLINDTVSNLTYELDMGHNLRTLHEMIPRTSNIARIITNDYLDNPEYLLDASLHFPTSAFEDTLFESSDDAINNLIYPIVIARTRENRHHFTRRSGWKCYQLIYTHSGSGVVSTINQIYHLEANSLFLLDCFSYHYFYADNPDGWDYSFVLFSGGQSDYLFSIIREKGLLHSDNPDKKLLSIVDDVLSISSIKSQDTDLCFHGNMTELLLTMCHQRAPSAKHLFGPDWIGPVMSYINEHYCEIITVEELANISYLSPSRFAHKFTEIVGCAPIEYQNRVRINRAQQLLENTNLPISAIGTMVGFVSESYFFSKFKRELKLSPAKYRKMHRKC